MHNTIRAAMAIAIALLVASMLSAVEPDGRVAMRYAWPDRTDGNTDAPRLRLSMTALTKLSDVHVAATIPPGVGLSMRDGAARGSWPAEGLVVRDLAAGETIVMEFDVAKPAKGGGVLGFVVEASADGRAVSEGVGIPVGVPGTAPTVRNGAAEFAAGSPESAP